MVQYFALKIQITENGCQWFLFKKEDSSRLKSGNQLKLDYYLSTKMSLTDIFTLEVLTNLFMCPFFRGVKSQRTCVKGASCRLAPTVYQVDIGWDDIKITTGWGREGSLILNVN